MLYMIYQFIIRKDIEDTNKPDKEFITIAIHIQRYQYIQYIFYYVEYTVILNIQLT